MKPESLPPMTVVRLSVDAFKRIEAAEVTPTATGIVPVRGRNGAGKSSLIESMLAALLGAKASPELPITEGHHTAEVVVDLGAIVVERKWTRDSGGKAKPKLVVRDANGGSLSSPQAVLDSLVGTFADPVAFLSMKPDEQTRTVLAVVGLADTLEELEAAERGAVERRRDVKRDADRAKKALQALAAEVAQLPDAGELDVKALSDELEAANRANAEGENARLALEGAVAKGKLLADAVADEKARIEELEAELAAARETLAHREQAVKDARTEYAALKAKADAYTPVDVAPIRAKLDAAREVAGAQAKREMHAKAMAEHETLAADAATCEDLVTEARDAIARLLGTTDFPVDGMSYDPDAKQITIGGIPFSQASSAERLVAAASVAMAGNPKIRVLFVREGSLVDDRMTATLAKLAEERGFQFWFEVVDSHRDGPGIYIEDGAVYVDGDGEANEANDTETEEAQSAEAKQ